MDRGNQDIHLVKVLSCKLPIMGKKVPSVLHKIWGLTHQPQTWEFSVLPLRHRAPPFMMLLFLLVLVLLSTRTHTYMSIILLVKH